MIQTSLSERTAEHLRNVGTSDRSHKRQCRLFDFDQGSLQGVRTFDVLIWLTPEFHLQDTYMSDDMQRAYSQTGPLHWDIFHKHDVSVADSTTVFRLSVAMMYSLHNYY